MKKYLRRAHFIVMLLCIAGAVMLIAGYRTFKSEAISQDAVLLIHPNDSYQDVRSSIYSLINSDSKRKAFDMYAKHIGLSHNFKPGRYTIAAGTSVVELARIISLGKQSPTKLIISNARTTPQLAGVISHQIAADSLEVLHTLYDTELRKELGYVRDSLIAMIIPNTYEVYWTTSPEQLLRRLKRESDVFWNKKRTTRLKHIGLSRYEVMSLAAIVYEETKLKSDMPRIAGVYMNRLKRRWPLQADPTVKYALQQFDLKRILKQHTHHRSPYNTYLNPGLPPAPICVPSIAAIDAVLNYEKHNYLYFCASDKLDGTHAFARTLKEHNANAQRYHAKLNRLKIK